jgi:pimeloyl-ACP methyl ester carboxylesterase
MRRLLPVVAVVAAIAVVAVFIPPVRAATKSIAVVTDTLDLPLPRPFAPEISRTVVQLDGVDGHVYAPRRGGPPVVLVPGATPQGLDDRRVINLAVALARTHRSVFLPDLELYDEELTHRDIDRIIRATAAITEESRTGAAIVVGISYGGSLAIIAAADPAIREEIPTVGVFGAYADLVGILQAITTGVSLVGGEEIPWDGHPDAEEVLHERVVELLPPDQRESLREALEGDRDPETLSDAAAALLALLENTDPARTYDLYEELPRDMRDEIAELSPVSALDQLEADLLVLHAVDDTLVPYGEALRFVEHHPETRLYPLETFGHVGAEESSPGWIRSARDLLRLWRFATRVIAPQEGVVPHTIRRDAEPITP